MIEIQINIIPKWKIKGFDDYAFGEDKKLYNLKTNKEVIQKLKVYTRGYNLNGKFKSLKNIKPLLVKYSSIECPF